MGRRIAENLIANQFREIGVHQQLNQANQKIEELKREIEQLRQGGRKEAEQEKVVELHASLKEQGITLIDVERIEPNPEQPRQTFSDESLMVLARSMENDGQQQPLLVFPQSDDKYLLFDGERRWRAAQKLDWKQIKVVIVPLTSPENLEHPETLRRQALLANHHRENINPLDLAEALVKEITGSEQINAEELPRLLNTVIMRLSRQDKLKILSELVLQKKSAQLEQLAQWTQEGLLTEKETRLLSFLLALGLNPTSVKNNIFPTLKLYDDLKEAIRNQGLGGHHARVLQRLSTEAIGQSALEIRQKVTHQVNHEKLSVTQTRKLVSEIVASHQESETSQSSRSVQRFLSNLKQLEVSNINTSELEVLKKELSEKLMEVKQALAND